MPLEQLHVLLTYTCNFECDHCFVYSGPKAPGIFTIDQVRQLLDQAQQVPSIEWVYFEGGEAFLYYPLLLESVREARDRSYHVGIVSNAYWATTDEDAVMWLTPLAELGLAGLSVSNDRFHYDMDGETPATRAARAARTLGIPVGSITIEPTGVDAGTGERGAPVVGGDVMFRGRAVDTLVAGLPQRPAEVLVECPYEDLQQPTRVHVDPYGHVQVCQGLSIGNVWDAPMTAILNGYDPATHEICGPLVRGGPAALASECGVTPVSEYVDECHMCFEMRRGLLDRFPAELVPAQVYGRRPVASWMEPD